MKQNVILLVGLVASLTLTGCHNPADDVAEAETSEAQKVEASASAVPTDITSYAFTEESTIGFNGSKITGSHSGGFKTFEGGFNVKGSELVASQTIVIQMGSLWADSDKLAGHLKNADFFDVETFPTSTFTSTAIEKTAEGHQVTGNLTLHGVTKSISFPAEIQVGEDQVTVKAEFFIKRFDFDIKYAGRKDDLIRDEVVIKLDLTAKPASA
jgi:polyisoprenoid-binding protein YceI